MKSEPQHRTSLSEGSTSPEQNRQNSRAATSSGDSKTTSEERSRTSSVAEQMVLSAEEIEHVIRSIEKEYGSELTDNIKKAMREEISTAVPELTKALIPLIMEAGREGSDPGKLQQDWVKIFMEVMLPHMQKIVASSQ